MKPKTSTSTKLPDGSLVWARWENHYWPAVLYSNKSCALALEQHSGRLDEASKGMLLLQYLSSHQDNPTKKSKSLSSLYAAVLLGMPKAVKVTKAPLELYPNAAKVLKRQTESSMSPSLWRDFRKALQTLHTKIQQDAGPTNKRESTNRNNKNKKVSKGKASKKRPVSSLAASSALSTPSNGSAPSRPSLNGSDKKDTNRIWGKEKKRSKTTKSHNKVPSHKKTKRTHNPDMYKPKLVWDVLKDQGWTVVRARGDPLNNWHWIRPGKSVEAGVLNTDYFNSFENVVEYAKKRGLCDESDSSVWSGSTEESEHGGLSSASTVNGETNAEQQQRDQYEQSTDDNVNDESTTSNGSDSTDRQGSDPSVAESSMDATDDSSQSSYNTILDKLPREFLHVWPLLKDKLGFRFASDYKLPTVSSGDGKSQSTPLSFPNANDMREHLCKYGIPNFDKTSSSLTDEEHQDLLTWIRFAHVPANPKRWFPAVDTTPLLSNEEAGDLLCGALGFTYGEDGAYSRADGRWETLEDLRVHLRDTGAYEAGRRSRKLLSEGEMVRLKLWAALVDRPIGEYGRHE